MSLFNLLQSNDPAVQNGLLNFGLALLRSKGSFGNAVGQAGVAGQLGARDYRQQEALMKRAGINDQILQMQLAEQQRAVAQRQKLEALNKQFYRPPSAPAVDATGGMETSVDSPANASSQGGFDYEGYLNALPSIDPVAALNLRQSLRKQEPQIHTTAPGQKSWVLVNGKPQLVMEGAPVEGAKDPLTKLREARDALPPGHPDRQLYEDRIRKETTHAPPAQFSSKTEVKLGESVAAQVGPMLKESREKAIAGMRLVDSAQRILDAAEKGNLYAGPMANVQLKAAQWGASLGITGKDTAERIKNTRTVIRGMAEQAVAARSQLGGQAQISNSEQELLNKATSGDIGELTHAEVVQIASLNDRLGRQLYSSHTGQLDNLKANKDLSGLVNFYAVPPLPVSQSKPVAPSLPSIDDINAELAKRQGGR